MRLVLSSIFLACILSACGGGSSLQTTASNGELGQLVTQKADRLADEIAHVTNLGESWHTEALNDAAKETLNTFFQALGKGQAHHESLLPPLLSPDFQCSPLLPSRLEPVFDGGGFTVLRGPLPVEKGSGPSALSKTLTDLAEHFDGNSSIHADWKIFRVEALEVGAYETEVLVHLSGKKGDAVVQQNASWNIGWLWSDPSSAPKLTRITLKQFDQVQGQKTQFNEQTASIIGHSTAWREQFSRGTDDWCSRIDQAMGTNQYAHNGLAVGDVNNDGLDDLYLCQTGGLPNRLFVQEADGSASEIGARAGVDWLNESMAALIVDLNNDGHQDLAITTMDNLLVMEGNGTGVFQLVAELPFAGGYSLTAVDVQGDRLLDLYACRYNTSETDIGLPVPFHDARNGPANALFQNNGDFGFTDVTETVGLDHNNRRFSFASAWFDYDLDGDPDLYVANDFGRNNLYRNEDGRFRDVAAEAGVEDISAGMGVSTGDYNRDGFLDLYISNMFSSAGQRISYQRHFREQSSGEELAQIQRLARGNSLFQNQGDGKFRDVTMASGTWMGRWAWGAQFVDFNNDGLEDLFVPNGFMTNANKKDL